MAKVGKISCKHEFTTNTGKTITALDREGVKAGRRSDKPMCAYDIHACLIELGAIAVSKAYKKPREFPEFGDVMSEEDYITHMTPIDIEIEDITEAHAEQEHGVEGMIRALFESKRKR